MVSAPSSPAGALLIASDFDGLDVNAALTLVTAAVDEDMNRQFADSTTAEIID